MKLNIPLLLLCTLCCTAGFIGCGNVVDNNDDVRENLISLTLETCSPDNIALGKKSSFLSPTDIIAQADNPKVAIIWSGMPYSDEWVYSTENTDTLCVTPDITASWPLKISFNLKDPPVVTAHLKDHPESKIAVGFFVLFNDGNRNGRFDEIVQKYNDEFEERITPFGPYGYYNSSSWNGKDTFVSQPVQSLTQQGKDWVIGFSSRHGIVWASDQRACDWLNKNYTYQDVVDREIMFEMRYAALWEGRTPQMQPTDMVQFFDGIRTGYNLVNANKLELLNDTIEKSYRDEFNPVTKQWSSFLVKNDVYQFYIIDKFSRIDQSTIIPVIVSDDNEELFKWTVWDG
jgi:hypothetical protein